MSTAQDLLGLAAHLDRVGRPISAATARHAAWECEEGVTCVVCPDCAFTFDAFHTDTDGGYSCPVCVKTPARTEATTEFDPPRSWDDPRVCQNCVRTNGSYHGPLTVYVILNTRTGKYHSGRGYGETDCGLDATTEEFLWPI